MPELAAAQFTDCPDAAGAPSPHVRSPICVKSQLGLVAPQNGVQRVVERAAERDVASTVQSPATPTLWSYRYGTLCW